MAEVGTLHILAPRYTIPLSRRKFASLSIPRGIICLTQHSDLPEASVLAKN